MTHATRRGTLSPEQRQARAQQLHDSITDQVEQLRGSQQWREYLQYCQSFYAYSWRNVLLIQTQHRGASYVAGFRQWQERGRQVRKGEQSIKIFGFAQRKARRDGDGDGHEAEKSSIGTNTHDEQNPERVTYFPVLSVFDISQTDLIDGADDPYAQLCELPGEDAAGLTDAIGEYLRGQGWDLTIAPTVGAMDGYTQHTTRRIVIADHLSAAQTAATLLHEAAHALLHGDLSAADYQHHRGHAEVEAESIAYVVAGALGLDTTKTSIGYITGWAGTDSELIAGSAARVLATSRTLIEAVTATPSPIED